MFFGHVASQGTYWPAICPHVLVRMQIIITAVLSWNAVMSGNAKELPQRLKTDCMSTMVRGWEFWIPAAVANFSVVPVSYQVLFMSFCQLLWNTYLSYVANKGG